MLEHRVWERRIYTDVVNSDRVSIWGTVCPTSVTRPIYKTIMVSLPCRIPCFPIGWIHLRKIHPFTARINPNLLLGSIYDIDEAFTRRLHLYPHHQARLSRILYTIRVVHTFFIYSINTYLELQTACSFYINSCSAIIFASCICCSAICCICCSAVVCGICGLAITCSSIHY
jgi:hypothetical protein